MPTGPTRKPQVNRSEEKEGRIYPSYTSYTLNVAAEDDEEFGAMVKPAISMSVTHQANRDDYAYHNRMGTNFGTSGADLHTDAPGGQMKLFGQHHEEGGSSVDFLRSTKSARVHVPALLALASQDLARTHPQRTLNASSDRSRFSEALVDKLSGNLGKQFTNRSHTNTVSWQAEASDWDAIPRGTAFAEEEVVSGGEFKAAQKTAREWVKPPLQGPKKPDPDYEQLRLF